MYAGFLPSSQDMVTAVNLSKEAQLQWVVVIASDNDYAQRVITLLHGLGVQKIEHVSSLSALSVLLQLQAIDIVITEIHVNNLDSIMLPCTINELNIAGKLVRIPHIIWSARYSIDIQRASPYLFINDDHTQQKLSGIATTAIFSHSRLAKKLGIQIELAWESSADLCLTLESFAGLAHPLPNKPKKNSSLLTKDDVIQAVKTGNGLRMVFQPQYNLLTNEMVGAEALIRWQHPQFGDIPPATFIPLVNKFGLDILLFNYIEKSVIDMLVNLDKKGVYIPIAINISAKTICMTGLAKRLADKMLHAGLPPQRLKVELTEEVTPANILSLSASVIALRSKGFLVSLDDFGAGSSTLALLSQISFDEVKVDGALVRSILLVPASRQIISGLVAFAKLCNFKLITEGIEDKSRGRFLNQLGCKVGQGYALSHPLEGSEFVKMVKHHNSVSRQYAVKSV